MRRPEGVPSPMSVPYRSRRHFLKRALGLGAAATGPLLLFRPSHAMDRPQEGIGQLDHVAIPIQNVDEMVTFYRELGFGVTIDGQRISIHFGDQKINFHPPQRWQRGDFTLRAPKAIPPCGDFCWVWEGSREALLEALSRVGAQIESEGERQGARDGGRAVGESVYVRDPDGNLLEFMRYPQA